MVRTRNFDKCSLYHTAYISSMNITLRVKTVIEKIRLKNYGIESVLTPAYSGEGFAITRHVSVYQSYSLALSSNSSIIAQ